MNIPTNNITELNNLIYAGAKLVCDRIGAPLRKQRNKQKHQSWVGVQIGRTNKKTTTTNKYFKQKHKHTFS